MKTEPTPNLFIVGAPKSGTTALYSYLSKHPEIFMSKLKEPQFFSADICGDQRNITRLSDYLSHFREARTEVIGEASTCYLGSRDAARQIREFCPPARVVVMLRNPIDVMYAEHSERLFDGIEHIANFATALDSSETRSWRFGRFRGQPLVRLNYRELGKFSEQVKRFIDVFGRPNVHVIVYDDFAKNPGLAYHKVLRFLGVSPSYESAFNVIHSNRRIRSTWAQDLLSNPPHMVRGLARAFLPQGIRHPVGQYLNRLNVKVMARAALDEQLRKRLQLEYEPEMRQLSKLLDRDFSNWTAG